jgi:hypothetical protein
VLNGPHGPLVTFGLSSEGGPAPAARASLAVSPGARPARLPDAGRGYEPMYAGGPHGVTALWTVETQAGDRVRISRLG